MCLFPWSPWAVVAPVDRKHPAHHHAQLPVGPAAAAQPICVMRCQIAGAWLGVSQPSPNLLPAERCSEATERERYGWGSRTRSARDHSARRAVWLALPLSPTPSRAFPHSLPLSLSCSLCRSPLSLPLSLSLAALSPEVGPQHSCSTENTFGLTVRRESGGSSRDATI